MIARIGIVRTLLRTLTLPHWRQHRVRTGLTIAGVALGVATVVVVVDLGDSVIASFDHMLATMAGDMELEVTSPAGTVPEAMLAVAAAVPGVQHAAGVVEAFVPLANRPDESLYLVGIDFLGSRAWERQFPRSRIAIDDELVFVSQPTSIALTPALADRFGISPDGPLEVVAPGGVRTLYRRGTLGDIAPASLFDGSIGVMDLPAAQLFLDRVDRLDRIGIRLARDASVQDVRGNLAAALGNQVEVASPELRGQQAERALVSLRSMLLCNASFAVIVGGLIVYHTVAVSVRQRRRELALVEMLGVRRGALLRLGMLETAILASIGSVVGVGLGRVSAEACTAAVGQMVSEIWLRVHVAATAHSAAGALVAFAVGILSALAAAIIAFRSTFRMATVDAMRPPQLAAGDTRYASRSVAYGLTLVASAWLLALAPPGLGLWPQVAAVSASHDAAYFGVCLLAPALVVASGGAVRRLGRRARWLPLRLAAENLPRAPVQGGATVAIIAIATGMAVANACLVRSFEHAWLGWIEQHFAADLFVGAGARLRLLAGPPMSAEVARRLAGVPGVGSVEPFRVMPFRLGAQPTFLQGVSIEDRLRHGGLAMVDGDFEQVADALRAGTGVLLSDNLATRLGHRRGNEIRLETPAGERTFRIEGTFLDYQGSLDLGAIAVASTQLAAIWGDESANLFRVWLEPHADVPQARARALARLGPGYFVMTGHQFIDASRRVLKGFFTASWMLSVVIALVGIIGVVNAQLATVLDRASEIATLRTVGVARVDLTRCVLLECGFLGALGGTTGAALGTMLGAQFVRYGLPLVTGWRIPLAVPVTLLTAVVASAALVSAFAGYVPARSLASLGETQRSLD